jgi:23S rRNA (guanosine2251-2'-O)-methyltransferase
VSQPFHLTLVLDNIRSLHNVGALFRTADAVGLEEVILCGLTPSPPRHEIEKTALGATKTVPWRYAINITQILDEFTEKGYQCLALEQTPTAKDIFTFPYKNSVVLVVGHERMGVGEQALLTCQALEIPMHGLSAYSLNVSVAGGIALYHIRQHIVG